MRGPGSGAGETKSKRRAGVNEDKKGRRAWIVFRSPARSSSSKRRRTSKSERRKEPAAGHATASSQQTLQAALGGVRACVLLLSRWLKQKLFFPLGAYRPMLSQVSIIYHRHICVGCSQLRKIERASGREGGALWLWLAMNPWL